MRLSALLVVVVALLGARADAQTSAALGASLSVAQHDYDKDADVEVTVALTNGTSHVIDVPAQSLETAVLLLDVQDVFGKHVPTVPPPVPRSDLVHFAPGQRRVVKVRLGVFSPPLKTGDYGVRPSSSVASGSAVSFHIR